MNESPRKEVLLSQLSRLEGMRLYWGCYWRAVLFVLAQIVIMLPISWFAYFGVDRWIGRTGSVYIISGLAAETVSVILGFCFVAMYVRCIVGQKIGYVRFVLVTEVEQLKAKGAGTGGTPGAA